FSFPRYDITFASDSLISFTSLSLKHTMFYVFCLCASVAAQLMSGVALLRCSGDGSGGWQFTIHMYKFQKKNKQEQRSPHLSGGGGNMDDHAHVCAKKKKKEKR
ncbi:unnamed protein product, partial [Ixodes persulcatus]